MSVSTTSNRIVYTGNGATVNFSVTFQYYDQSHLQVYVDGTLKTLTTHYTVLPTTNTPHGTVGGTVTFLTAPANGLQVLILRVVPNTQASVLQDLSPFPATTVEGMSDLLTFRNQEQDEKFGRAILLPVTSTLSNVELPDPALTANQGKYLQTVSTGLQLVAGPLTGTTNPLTTKGDLIVGDATGLVSRLAVGSNGAILVADSAQAKGVKWSGALYTAKGDIPVATASATPAQQAIGNDGDTLEADSTQTNGLKWTAPNVSGQGRLTYVNATSIIFSPFLGNRVRVKSTAWRNRLIPSAGITAANTNVFVGGVAAQNLAASTAYNVYLFDNAGTLTIDFRTTARATDTTTGVEICSGVDTRTLIGKVYTNASSQFEDAVNLRHVITWYNRRMVTCATNLTVDTTYASATFGELSSSLRTSYLTWGDSVTMLHLTGSFKCDTAGNAGYAITNDDLVTAQAAGSGYIAVNGAAGNCSINRALPLAEGRHFGTLLVAHAVGTGTWYGGDATAIASGVVRYMAHNYV